MLNQDKANDNNIYNKNFSVESSKLHNFIFEIMYSYRIDMLKEIVAIDNGQEIELKYRLHSADKNKDIIISTTVKDKAQTVTDIFKSAIADENEIYDLFGIVFSGNKYLKRLYMPSDWEGFPLRKDYKENDRRLAWNDNNNT